jgi:undecaprenyl-diphosphatase
MLLPHASLSPLEAILLGLVQGLTEFLPVSSSGHLVLAQRLLNVRESGILLEIALHTGTLFAVVVALRRDLVRIVQDLIAALAACPRKGLGALRRASPLGWLIVATLPAAIAGLLLRKQVEAAFESPRAAAGFLILTGVILLATRFRPRAVRPMNASRAFIMGLAQAVSLLPGVSRSGSTTSAGMLAGVAPPEALRFSFLMSVPAILGSIIVSLPDWSKSVEASSLPVLTLGTAMSFLAGLAAIAWLMRIVAHGRFHWFGVYCLIVGLAGVFLLG